MLDFRGGLLAVIQHPSNPGPACSLNKRGSPCQLRGEADQPGSRVLLSLTGHQFTWHWKGHTGDLLEHRQFSCRIDEPLFQEIATWYKSTLPPYKPRMINAALAPLIVLWTLQGPECNRFGLERGSHQRDAWEPQLLGQALTAGLDSIGLPHSTSLRKREKFQPLHDVTHALVAFVLKPWL